MVRTTAVAAIAAAIALETVAFAQSEDPSDFVARRLLESSSAATSDAAISDALRGSQFGTWHVAKQTDSMSPTTIVSVVTVAEVLDQDSRPTGRYNYFGFQFIGPNLVTVMTSARARNYWPYCDLNSASVSVDGARARYIAEVSDPGNCNRVNMSGQTLQQMRAGSSAKVRVLSRDLAISLDGLTAALNHARSLAR